MRKLAFGLLVQGLLFGLLLGAFQVLPLRGGFQVEPTVTTGPTPNPVAHTTSWRAPFSGVNVITAGPGENLHTGVSAEAIDYAPSPPASFQILAPADGVVWDYLPDPPPVDQEPDNLGFGNVLVLYHEKTQTYSFFAHLQNVVVNTARFTPVTQGQHIADSGDSGRGGSGFHLHFEARTGYQGDPARTDDDEISAVSGAAFPIHALMGNWWNPWYAPPSANATVTFNLDLWSGAAQHPEDDAPPPYMTLSANTQTPGPRHLSGNDSPPGFSSGYVSNITDTSVFVHMGAAPDAPNLSTDAYFRFFVFQGSTNQWWQLLPGNDIEGPTYPISYAGNQCSAVSSQYCFKIQDVLRVDAGQVSGYRYIDVFPGVAGAQPHVVASYNAGEATVFLEYVYPSATCYKIWENHGGENFLAYQGLASQITVNRIIGAPNAYQVSAQAGAQGCAESSGWLTSNWVYLHDETVSIPTATPTPTNTPTATPTATPSPTNVAPSATVSVSSQYNSNFAGPKAVDGVIGQWGTGEWASAGQLTPWIQLSWASPQIVDRIRLYDRPNLTDQVNAGILTFSDGSSVCVGALPNDGTLYEVTFAPKTVTWTQLNVNSGYGYNVGLSEFQVFAVGGGTPPPVPESNVAPNATVSVSSQYNSDFAGLKAVDCVIGLWGAGEWASAGQLTPWIQLTWASPQTVTSIELYDRPNTTDKIDAGTLTFSDGSSVDVGALPDTGGAYIVTFAAKTITWVKFQVTSGVGSNVGLSEIKAFTP